MAVTMASAALSTVGTIAQGRAASKQAAFQAGVARQQAQRAEQQAKLDELRVRRNISADLASARAGFAASGIDPSSGSALLVQADGAGVGELDALTVRSNGLNRASQFHNQLALDAMRRGEIRRQSRFSAGTSLLKSGFSPNSILEAATIVAAGNARSAD